MTPPPTAVALGPDLADGTSGVALFLAHLHARTGDVQARDTAMGAARHALGHLAAIPVDRGLSLYTGRLGVVLAAARAGRVLGEAELSERAGRAAATLATSVRPPGDGLVVGGAGGACGLLALASELEDTHLAEVAGELAASLARRAGSLPLSGMAHGEAGVVHALLEVAARSGEARLLDAAERAIAHERTFFDTATGNWADLRPNPGDERDGVVARSAMSWSDGAPGILLSRRRAATLLTRTDGPDIAAAAHTVERWIRAAVATRPGDLSLGLGLTGTAECLRDGVRDGADDESARRLALEVAARAAEEFEEPGPFSMRDTAKTPGLMRGLAGIGLFHLRLEDPGIPSILAPGATSVPPAGPWSRHVRSPSESAAGTRRGAR